MTKQWWKVETQATVRRQYEVFAESEKEAEAISVDSSPDHEEDMQEETMSVVPSNKVQSR